MISPGSVSVRFSTQATSLPHIPLAQHILSSEPSASSSAYISPLAHSLFTSTRLVVQSTSPTQDEVGRRPFRPRVCRPRRGPEVRRVLPLAANERWLTRLASVSLPALSRLPRLLAARPSESGDTAGTGTGTAGHCEKSATDAVQHRRFVHLHQRDLPERCGRVSQGVSVVPTSLAPQSTVHRGMGGVHAPWAIPTHGPRTSCFPPETHSSTTRLNPD